MSLRPITQAESDAWDAQPGTDVFGRPWSSWDRVILTEHQADLIAVQLEGMLLKQRARAKSRAHTWKSLAAEVARETQLELEL